MFKFSPDFKPKNKNIFPELFYNLMISQLRQEIYKHVISHNENDYFSLDKFIKKVDNKELSKRMVNEIMSELEQLGWNCKISFGDTALFIYSGNNIPVSLWENVL